MNITQGVPRIREIINAVKAISTPIIKVTLENPLYASLSRGDGGCKCGWLVCQVEFYLPM